MKIADEPRSGGPSTATTDEQTEQVWQVVLGTQKNIHWKNCICGKFMTLKCLHHHDVDDNANAEDIKGSATKASKDI